MHKQDTQRLHMIPLFSIDVISGNDNTILPIKL